MEEPLNISPVLRAKFKATSTPSETVSPKITFEDEDVKLALAKGKTGYPPIRPGSFLGDVKAGSQTFKDLAEIEAQIGATKGLNVAHHQRKHPISEELEADL